jgi:hypothetical protein
MEQKKKKKRRKRERVGDVRVRDETTAMVACDGSEQRERRRRGGGACLCHVGELLPHSQ